MHEPFIQTLIARGPHPSLGDHAQTYARVIGSWTGELHNHMAKGPAVVSSVEAHFAWVLEGRAVQDTWIAPARADRASDPRALLNWYGSTLRVFEPAIEAWRTVWTDPLSQLRIELVGRRQARRGPSRLGSCSRMRCSSARSSGPGSSPSSAASPCRASR